MDEDENTAAVEVVDGDVNEAPDAVVEASPTIIVETAEPDEGSDVEPALVDAAIDQAGRLAALEVATADLIGRVDTLEARSQVHESVINVQSEFIAEQSEVIEDMGDAVTEVAADTVDEAPDLDGDGEPDVPPETARRHWMFRSRDEWRGR